MRPPIGGCLFRRLTLLHFFGCGTLSQGNDFPFLRLIREFERFDELVAVGVAIVVHSGEMRVSVVFIFCLSF